MRIRLIPAASLTTLLTLSTLALAQNASVMPPPIKMGLWQSEITTAVSGAPDSPMGRAMGSGRTTVTQGCFTPESWTKEMQGAQQRRRAADCSQSNLQQDSHKVTYDEVCSNPGGYSNTIHFEMLIDDTENAHGYMDMKMSGAAFPEGMTMHTTLKTKYLSSDCGSVKPGEAKVIH